MLDNLPAVNSLEASSLQTITTTMTTTTSPLMATTPTNTSTTTTTAITTTATTTTTSTTSGLPNRDEARRLFMGNLPKVKSEVEICEEVSRNTDGLVRVITYKNFENPMLHRGFCFLDYESGAAAAEAKRRLSGFTVFGCKTIVDWADPEPEADAQQMAVVRILFVRQYGGTLDERTLANVFGRYGKVERVKNLKNYAFVHFERRSDAKDAMDALDGAVDEASGVRIDVSWAKPPAEKHIRERVLRDRERRIRLQTLHGPHRSEHENVPIWFEDKTCESTAPGFSSNTDSGSTVPYSNYDHYKYDFGRQTFGCTCRVQQNFEMVPPPRQPELQQRQPEQQKSCRYVTNASMSAVALTSSMNGNRKYNNSDDGNGQIRQQPQRIPLQNRNTVETSDSRAGTSTERHDHGDCANDITYFDSIILKFFHKISQDQ